MHKRSLVFSSHKVFTRNCVYFLIKNFFFSQWYAIQFVFISSQKKGGGDYNIDTKDIFVVIFTILFEINMLYSVLSIKANNEPLVYLDDNKDCVTNLHIMYRMKLLDYLRKQRGCRQISIIR